MTFARLDPWNDAAVIAARLKSRSARLVLIIGAESWCETCRALGPVFDTLAQQSSKQDDTWLWLDLEDHADFLDNFIPDSLPLLMSYSGAELSHAVIPTRVTEADLLELLARPSVIEHSNLPDVRGRLMANDWAL
ncbi:thioredoxin [Massilia sp. CCM 8695]|uniref:Thioredoxin n=1 Tax=Massilia frigida TaxID=2609281 RepID=A0ABX0NIX2_9BURK|nr:thioredoxin family protein [Massilia frigida]NHZ83542.1 thioredoxin [Massilia frigida]